MFERAVKALFTLNLPTGFAEEPITNASKHHALSWDHACKLEQQLRAEVDELIRLAEQTDSEEISDEMDIPEELCRRQGRLAAIAQAKAIIEDRAAQRYALEQKEYDEKVALRLAKAEATGKRSSRPLHP